MNLFIHMTFADCSNPCIITTYQKLFRLICKYDYEDFDGSTIYYARERKHKPKSYREYKDILRNFAIAFSSSSDSYLSWFELASIQGFFAIYGKKFGLLREVHENAIC